MSRSRYKEFYNTVVRADLLSKMQYKNVHQIPRVTQIAVSVATTLKPSGLDNPVAAAFMVWSFIVVVLNFIEDIRLDLALLDLRNDLMSMPFANEDEGLWDGEGRGTGRTLGAAMEDTGSCMGNILGGIGGAVEGAVLVEAVPNVEVAFFFLT